MHLIGIVLLVLASAFTAQWAARRGAAARGLRWLSVGLAAAALGLALWTVRQTLDDHRRAAPAETAPAPPGAPAAGA